MFSFISVQTTLRLKVFSPVVSDMSSHTDICDRQKAKAEYKPTVVSSLSLDVVALLDDNYAVLYLKYYKFWKVSILYLQVKSCRRATPLR